MNANIFSIARSFLTLCSSVLLSLGMPAQASDAKAWDLNNSLSRLSFVSIKATDIGEVHSFTQLAGKLTDDGQVQIAIELASVETLIPIRNQRMQTLLFETEIFPTATLRAKIDPALLSALSTGGVVTQTVDAKLSVRDQTTAITLEVIAAKTSAERLVVSTLQPVLLNAGALGLSEGVEKLRAVAGLPNISQAVPVSVFLTFDR